MKLKGLVSSFVMLALILSVFAVPFASMAGWDDSSSSFTFAVTDADAGSGVPGASWTVKSVITGEIKDSGVTDAQGDATTKTLEHGNYLLTINKDGYQYRTVLVEYLDGDFRQDGDSDFFVELTKFDPKTIEVTVNNIEVGAQVTVTATMKIDKFNGVSVTNTTVATGVSQSVNITIMDGVDHNFTVTAKKDGSNYIPYAAVGNDDFTANMETGVVVNGKTTVLAPMDVTFVSKNESLKLGERVIRADVTNRDFSAALADDQEYWVFIMAAGYKGLVGDLTITGGTWDVDGEGLSKSGATLRAVLTAKGDDKHAIDREFNFEDNMSTIEYAVTIDAGFSYSIGVLDYHYLPLRMQIDLLYGDGNGTVEQSEVDAFLSALENKTGAFPSVTDSLLAVDGVTYQSNGNLKITQIGESLQGLVNSTERVSMALKDNYTALDSIEVSTDHEAKAKMVYDTADFDNTYTFILPDDFEVNRYNSLVTPFLKVERVEAGKFVFDPQYRDASPITVTMELTTSAEPTAIGEIVESDYAYAVMDDGELDYYIVGIDRDITFDASQSVDGNGNPLANFNWTFGDGKSAEGEVVTHNYTVADNFTVTLTVENFYGANDAHTFEVKVDAVAPEAEIVLVTKNPRAGQSVSFAGHNSTDDIFAGDGLGKIAKWSWDFGDGNTANRTTDNGNVSHVFQSNGTYTVTLTVFDVAGNNDTVTKEVEVFRAEAPKFSVKLPDVMPSFEEGTTSRISVTVNNTGTFDAENVLVTLYYMSGGDWKRITDTTISDLAVGEEQTVQLSWNPGSSGDKRIKAVASVTYQGAEVEGTAFATVPVDEAGWRNIAIFAAVILVIVLVIALVYFRNRLPSRGKLNLKGGKDQFSAPAKVEKPPVEDFEMLEEPRKRPSQQQRSSQSRGKKRR